MQIAYTDKRLNVWYVDLEKNVPVHIDTDTYAGAYTILDPSWSPDSRWIAYTRKRRSHLHAVCAYSLEQAKSHQLTDGMSDALYAASDKDGRYLYFTASTDVALSSGWLDMSSLRRPVTRSVAVEAVMELLKKNPTPTCYRPPYPNYQRRSAPQRLGNLWICPVGL